MNSKIIRERFGGANSRGELDQVVSTQGGNGGYRKKPCPKCPWRVDAVGEFSPGAFVHSANTAYDMAKETFACHDSGVKKTAACAGFLLRGADHNLTVRMQRMEGKMLDVQDGNVELHENYRAMAIANGVDPEDSALAPCRD